MKDKGAEWEDTPNELQSTSCLNDNEIIAVVNLAEKLENLMGVAQDIEWAFDADFSFPDNLFLLQNRPAKVVAKKTGSSTDQLANKLVGTLKSMDLSKTKDKIKNIEFRF